MELEAISGAATVALASTIVFMLIAKSWNALCKTVASTPSFADRIMHEAAQRFRDELERLSNSQAIYLSGTLVFAMLFFAAYVLQARALFVGYPAWQLYLQLGFLALASGYALFLLIKTVLARYQVKFLRDANVAIGHQLQQLTTGYTRVYHDVATTAGVIDHVMVGQSGLYAVNVIARRARKRGTAQLHNYEIELSDSKKVESIVNIAAKSKRLQKEFRELLGHAVRVRSVIALPGWDIHEQTDAEHLLVNEQTLSMLNGWKDKSDHLMNEDVEALQTELTARCVRI